MLSKTVYLLWRYRISQLKLSLSGQSRRHLLTAGDEKK